MELVFVIAAFLAGFIALRCKLPPLVGFLLAGFALNSAGFHSTETLTVLADLGVTLLLFTIGLKLDVKTLLTKEIWGGATLHNLLSTALFTLALLGFKQLGIGMLADLELMQLTLLAFALSFSSTVFAIKALQEKGELNATYGTLSIGILVMQDIFAVLFLTISTGKVPEITALGLFALPLLRPLMFKLLDKAGHGEMLVLYAIFLALVAGAGLFELVGMKADLGALILGMMLAAHPKASEMSKTLFNLKELLLVCFFLNIGLAEQPTFDGFLMAILLLLLLPIKGLLYYVIFNLCRYRVRTSLLGTLTLFNYSEFGLIVSGMAYKLGWLPGNFLVAIAIAVSLSFLIAAPLNSMGHRLYTEASKWLKEYAPEKLNANDQLIDLGDAKILILGMGRIGSGAYDELVTRYGKQIIGVENRDDSALNHRNEGRNVIHGDATDPDFWARVIASHRIKLILLAMPHSQANTFALEQVNLRNYDGKVAAIAKYNDDEELLHELGVDAAFNIYNEAGSGFARHVCEHLKPDITPI
ncbi:cation:proton antiporter family protein [Photobacterium profundum]|uniref:Glutathione-regulated potassium-efflux system protein KefB n=1 Tax=Photobacterium profundum (strain SS9) TaxID=298386 RepID=Q6LTD7_PHOPR|nr:cation:proton antiporter family protein [Photobacterium profundum]CAG19439.1 putative glutathione-regulated potassium-efflux system protein KefB [Photobacterium profundum SS9]